MGSSMGPTKRPSMGQTKGPSMGPSMMGGPSPMGGSALTVGAPLQNAEPEKPSKPTQNKKARVFDPATDDPTNKAELIAYLTHDSMDPVTLRKCLLAIPDADHMRFINMHKQANVRAVSKMYETDAKAVDKVVAEEEVNAETMGKIMVVYANTYLKALYDMNPDVAKKFECVITDALRELMTLLRMLQYTGPPPKHPRGLDLPEPYDTNETAEPFLGRVRRASRSRPFFRMNNPYMWLLLIAIVLVAGAAMYQYHPPTRKYLTQLFKRMGLLKKPNVRQMSAAVVVLGVIILIAAAIAGWYFFIREEETSKPKDGGVGNYLEEKVTYVGSYADVDVTALSADAKTFITSNTSVDDSGYGKVVVAHDLDRYVKKPDTTTTVNMTFSTEPIAPARGMPDTSPLIVGTYAPCTVTEVTPNSSYTVTLDYEKYTPAECVIFDITSTPVAQVAVGKLAEDTLTLDSGTQFTGFAATGKSYTALIFPELTAQP